jgi:hypothetical protein
VTRQRRILLVLLGVSVLAAGMGSFLYVQLDRMRLLDGQIGFLRKQYLKLPADAPTEQAGLEERLQGLKRVEADELSRYYTGGEMDLYRFGSLVNSLLARRGITVERFRTLSGSSAPVLELSAQGTSVALMAFLSDVSASAKYWTIPYLHVQSPAGNGNVTCELQIGYLVHEAAK